MGTKSDEIDKYAKEKGVKIIYVINKTDLVPSDNLSKWVKHFKS